MSVLSVAFSKQWNLQDVYGHGFAGPPFDVAQTDGPIQLTCRGSDRHVAFDHGMPEGFSGGPSIGRFRDASYCVGLNWLGGVGYAAGVLIPAARCVEFLNTHYPAVSQLDDLSMKDLEMFLVEQDATFQNRRGRPGWRIATAFSAQEAKNTLAPLLEISEINCRALKWLKDGVRDPQIAIALEGREFLQWLRSARAYPDVEGTLLSYLCQAAPVRLEFTDVWRQSFRAGHVVLFVLGYERAYLGEGYDLLRTFMNRFAARSAHA